MKVIDPRSLSSTVDDNRIYGADGRCCREAYKNSEWVRRSARC